MWQLAIILCLLTLRASAFTLPFITQGSPVVPPTITSLQLSGSSVQFAAAGPYYVGTLTANLSPQTPTFNNISGNSYSLVSSGGSCSGGDTTHFQIIGDGVYTNTLAANASPGYKLCVTASAAGVASLTATFTGITEGNKVDAQTFCAANGGGSGSSGSPWQAACIQAAVNAAVTGDTIFLAAGNWAMNTGATGVSVVSSGLNVVGVGSGNVFNVYGNPTGPNGSTLNGPADSCPTTLSTVTCVATAGTNTHAASGGWMRFETTCSNVKVAHIFFDGSLSSAGGSEYGTFVIRNCNGPVTVDDIHVLSLANSDFSQESQGTTALAFNVVLKNSIFDTPLYAGSAVGQHWYSGSNPLATTNGGGLTFVNDYWWSTAPNIIYIDNVNFTGNYVFMGTDSNGNTAPYNTGFGPSGCGIGYPLGSLNPPGTCPANGGYNGSYNLAFTNNYLLGTGRKLGFGGGLNDPGTGGGLNNLSFSGNTITADLAALDTCVWHQYDFTVPNNPYDPANSNRPYAACVPAAAAGGADGMQLNGTVQSDCTSSGIPATCVVGSTGGSCLYSNTNNSLISGTTAQIVGAGGGGNVCNNGTVAFPPGVLPHDNSVFNFSAQNNYLQSPHNLWLYSAPSLNESLSPSVTANYCDNAAHSGATTFTQTDSSTCATTGFTSLPTASFTAAPLQYDVLKAAYEVPITSPAFTAQYGAVQWLASTSSTTPTSGGQTGTGCNGGACSWSVVPPVYLIGANHGNTVYLWTMDSLNHISAAASHVIP